VAFSQAASRFSDSQSARSWQSKRARKARLIAEWSLQNRPAAAGERGKQVGAQLVAHRDPVAHQVLAGPAGLPQRGGGWAVGDQRPQPGPVGAQDVGEHVGVEPVVLVARRPVPGPQVLHLPRGDHHHGHTCLQQGIHDRPIAALDRSLGHPRPGQTLHKGPQPLCGVLHAEPGDHPTSRVDNTHGMVGTGPVDPS
jgi:hypothetical protein